MQNVKMESFMKQKQSLESEAGRPPKILEHPVDSVVPRNEPVTLGCKAEGDPPPEVTWLKDGKLLRSSEARQVRVYLPSGSLFFLRVRKDLDTGVYECIAHNSYGEARSRNATLDVATLRDEFRTSPQNTWVAQGDTAMLDCEPPKGNPEPKVLWKKNGQVIDLKANGRYRIIASGGLTISHVRQSDEGRYTCVAKNMVGIRQSNAALLRVTVRPQFTIVPANTSALLGSDVSLACVARGDPPPEITWKKQSGDLPLKRAHFDEERFLISNVSETDVGVYLCVAENKAGSIVSSATVSVLAPPVLTVVPQNIEIQPNTTAFIGCQAEGEPQPTLFWSKEGSHSIVFQGSSSGNVKVTPEGTLQIDNISERDEGGYICAAVSSSGSVMHKVDLKVTTREDLPPPIITMGPMNQTRPIGSVAIMPCIAHGGGGFPVPILTWYKDGNSFQLNHRIFTDDAGTLRINDLETSDSGMYECVASSKSGKYVWRSFLHVEHPSNPHAVFRRTGFEMASQRPREPMKPFVVKIESTSVTIAWHARFLHFTDEEDDHSHRAVSGEEFRRGIIGNEEYQNKREGKTSGSDGKIEFGAVDQPPPPFSHYNHHQHPSFSLHEDRKRSDSNSGSGFPKPPRNSYDDDDDNEEGMVDDDPKTESLIEKSAFVAENDYYKGNIRNKRFSYTDDMNAASGDILSDAASKGAEERGNGKIRNRSQSQPSEPVLQLQPVGSNLHQDKSSQRSSSSDNGREKIGYNEEAENDNQSQKINNFNPFENDRNHDNGNEESDEKSGESFGPNDDDDDVDTDDIIREDDNDDEDEDYKEEKTKFQESVREAKYIEQGSVKAVEEGNRGRDGDDTETENNLGVNNLIISSTSRSSSSNAIPKQKLSSNYKNADYFPAVVTSIEDRPTTTESPPSSLSFSTFERNASIHPNQITYKVEYYSAEESKTEWLLGATNVPIEIFRLHYLKPNTEYIFFVRAVNSADGLVSEPSPLSDPVVTAKMGTSKYSLKDLNAARAKLDSSIVVLLKHAYPTSSMSIKCEWQLVNAGDFVEGFLIYYRPLQNNDDGSYQMLTVLNIATTFQITGLDKFSTYQIFLVPFYKNIEGRPSNYINVTTAQDVPSVAPELLDPVAVNSSALVVRWKSVPSKYQNGIVLGYQLRVWSGSALVGNMTTNGSTLSLLLNNLIGGRQYSLQIACFTSKGVGPFSSMKTLHFRPDVPLNNNENNINVYTGGDRISVSRGNGESGATNSNGNRRHKDKSLDGSNINFGGTHNNMENNNIFDDSSEDFDPEGLIRSTNPQHRNFDSEILSEVWFIALIGSLIFFMLLVFVAVLYLRRCQLRHGSDKLKVSTTEIPDGSMPPHYPNDNGLWIDSPHQQSKQLSLKSVKTSNNDMMNEYENGNNYAVVEERLSPIAYATTTLVNGEKHKSNFSLFGEPIKGMLSLGNGHGPGPHQQRPSDFGMISASPKILGWTSSSSGVTAAPIIPGNNKTGSLNICSQDMKKPSWYALMSAEPSLSEPSSSSYSKNSPKYSRKNIERTPSGMLSKAKWQRSHSHSPNNRKLMPRQCDGSAAERNDGDGDDDPELGKGTSLNVLTTFQTPLPSRKHLIVDYTNGQSVNSILQYHEPRLSTYSSISNNNSNHNGYTNHNAF